MCFFKLLQMISTDSTVCLRYLHVLFQAVTNDQIQTPQYAQGIPMCFCKLLQMARCRLHGVCKVYSCAFASCFKWPDTDSTVCSRYTHVLLKAITNGQIQTPHCAPGISMCCCTVLQITRNRLHIVLKFCKLLQMIRYKLHIVHKVLQMARYRQHIVRNVYPCAVASCYKWPDTETILSLRYIHVLLQGASNGQILTPYYAQGISICCCTV